MGRGTILVHICTFFVSKEELLLHTKEATVVIGAKYGARNIAHDAPGCIGCALPRRYLAESVNLVPLIGLKFMRAYGISKTLLSMTKKMMTSLALVRFGLRSN